MYCHKCKHNGMKSEACLSCTFEEEYSYPNQKYIFDGFDFEQPETNFTEENKATHLSEEDEDKLRKALYELFRLNPLELLMVQAIMQGKSLTEYAESIEHLSKKNQTCSRHHAFQIRKAILKKLP